MGVVLFHHVVLHGDLLETVSVVDSQVFELGFVEELELHVSLCGKYSFVVLGQVLEEQSYVLF